MTLRQLLGVGLPIIQAPMAGVQGSELAIAVSNAGGLGSLPCAMLGLDTMRSELATIKAQCGKPFNVNFFCHVPPLANAERDGVWRGVLAPYHKELGIEADIDSERTGANTLLARKLPICSANSNPPW